MEEVHLCPYANCEPATDQIPINKTDGVNCFFCSSVFHLKCAVECGYEAKKTNYLWVCDTCFRNKHRFKSYIDATVKLLKTEVKAEFKSDLTKLEAKIEAKIEAAVKNAIPDAGHIPNIQSDQANVNIATTINKLEMKERRYNIILYGMPIDHETWFNPYPAVEQLFNVLKVPPGEIRDAVLLRKSKLIKVTLYSLRFRSTLLKRSKDLRTRTDDLKHVYINPDLSYEERQHEKTLRSIRNQTRAKYPDSKVWILKNEVLMEDRRGKMTTVWSRRIQHAAAAVEEEFQFTGETAPGDSDNAPVANTESDYRRGVSERRSKNYSSSSQSISQGSSGSSSSSSHTVKPQPSPRPAAYSRPRVNSTSSVHLN